MRQDAMREDFLRVKAFREKGGEDSSLCHRTAMLKGKESRHLVEEMQLDKRLHRVPMYAETERTWVAPAVKKHTRKECMELISQINRYQYKDPPMTVKQKRSVDKSPGSKNLGILR